MLEYLKEIHVTIRDHLCLSRGNRPWISQNTLKISQNNTHILLANG